MFHEGTCCILAFFFLCLYRVYLPGETPASWDKRNNRNILTVNTSRSLLASRVVQLELACPPRRDNDDADSSDSRLPLSSFVLSDLMMARTTTQQLCHHHHRIVHRSLLQMDIPPSHSSLRGCTLNHRPQPGGRQAESSVLLLQLSTSVRCSSNVV